MCFGGTCFSQIVAQTLPVPVGAPAVFVSPNPGAESHTPSSLAFAFLAWASAAWASLLPEPSPLQGLGSEELGPSRRLPVGLAQDAQDVGRG